MKSNQSLHITIKQPPNPKPISSLGIFENPGNLTNLANMIYHFLHELRSEPKDPEFVQNVKDEAMKLLLDRQVIAVSRLADGTEVIYLKPNASTSDTKTTSSQPRISS